MEHWTWRQRSVAAILWPSFLAACIACLLFFAKIDATRLIDAFVFDLSLSVRGIYSVFFLFFWAIALFASGLTTWLIRTERRAHEFPSTDVTDPTAHHAED